MALKSKLAITIILISGIIFCGLSPASAYGPPASPEVEERIQEYAVAVDTIPLSDRYGNFINDEKYNPFDILPKDVEQKVEYDADTDRYVILEKIGNEYYRTPSSMTFNEYLEWRAKKQEQRYFSKLAGIGDQYKSASGRLDPMSKVDIEKNLVDRLFGGNGITIEPQGNIDLNFGARYSTNRNPYIQEDQRTQWIVPDFGMDIKMNVDGKIGDKMDLGFNYDTNATFDFDRKIKLAYDSEKWTEDDILKKVEAGNVSLPLRSSLIQGAQELFGIKTELQFGRLRLTGIMSQQRSQQETLQIENGATVQEFVIRPEEYDENRHFFISHYHRNSYEEALTNLPYINNNFRVTNLEVWVSDDRANFQTDQTMICAVADMAEPDTSRFTSKSSAAIQLETDPRVIQITTDTKGRRLPENRVNNIYQKLTTDTQVKRTKTASSNLTSDYKLRKNIDYEIYRGRKLNSGEYYFNPELGFISLNIKMRPNQVLSVSYEYFYTNNCEDVYKVGSTSDEGSVSNTDRNGQVQSEGLLFTKLLKGSSQSVNLPTWDLMMKNVYPLRANQLDQAEFDFDIFYDDDFDPNAALKKFLPIEEGDFRFTPLLNLFGLDNLNSRNDPQPDGQFDFVPGVTVVPQNGSLIFPVLEPFGESLSKAIDEKLDGLVPQNQIDSYIALYAYPELYDTSIVSAQLRLERNKFVMKGRIKSSAKSEYSLGAWNIPQGSVSVRAGSVQLVEGVHFEVDYGIGRVRILDQSIIQQGVPVNISFEDNSVFSLQQKSMMGLRAEYKFSDNFYIGGTAMRLAERPFTNKVNLGDDPIRNKVYGLDMDYSKEAPWVTKVVDKLPFYSTDKPSNINFSAEVAALRPGHNPAINGVNTGSVDSKGGVVSFDDFEGAVSGYPLSSQPDRWSLASIPQIPPNENQEGRWLEANAADARTSTITGVNRARLSWYVIDRFANVPEQIKEANPFTRRIDQRDLFNRDLPLGQLTDLLTFDMTYYPDERGPYNFDLPGGTAFSEGIDTSRNDTDRLYLSSPETRWAGIQRYLNNNDFEAANYEFIEFWMLNPFDSLPAPYEQSTDGEEGFLTFHLGNISEDILLDDQQFYENSLPQDGVAVEACPTSWGVVPLAAPINDAFAGQNFAAQDLGLDGLSNMAEFDKHESYINTLQSEFILPLAVSEDPAGDDYVYFNNQRYQNEDNLLERYKLNNNPEGNSPDISNQQEFQRGNPIPDKEDLNNNKSLDSGESFHEYRVKFKRALDDRGRPVIDSTATDYIRDIIRVTNNSGHQEAWYRFRIPLNDSKKVNGISGFRSIQFIRILVNGFQTVKTFRMADFELVRNQWRKLPSFCSLDGGEDDTNFSIDVVGVQENSDKQPFGYVSPRGIVQEQTFSNFSAVLQDENALVMRFEDLEESCEVKIGKLSEIDLRVFERMEMFVHAEVCRTDSLKIEDERLENNDISTFIRVGKDFSEHYYEYEIPMTLSDSIDATGSDRIWPTTNKFNFPLDLFIQVKKLRNLAGGNINEEFVITSDSLQKQKFIDQANKYESIDPIIDEGRVVRQGEVVLDTLYLPPGHKIRIRGNPNLGLIKGVAVGVRNNDEDKHTHCGEVWINELRLAGLQERGGVAGLARLDIQLADLGSVTASAGYSSIGWGALDQKVNERAKEELIEYDIATNLQLGKFFPENWGIQLPFYGQYAKEVVNPEFDSYDYDITVKDEFDLRQDSSQVSRDGISQRNQQVTTIKTFNFTNVRKEKVSKRTRPKKADRGKLNNPLSSNKPKQEKQKKPMPWDISNFSASYAYSKTTYRDFLLAADDVTDQFLGLDYSYSRRGSGITPFKKLVKSKALKIIKEFNFNPVPNSFTFNSSINRYVAVRRFRLPETPVFEFDDRSFDWTRTYDLNWNLTKALKLNFSANNVSYIDEVRQVGIAENLEDRDYKAFIDNGNGLELETVNADVANNPNYVKDYWRNNLRNGGRNTNYDHNISVNYTLPTKLIPYMDWIDIKGQYRSDYSWSAGALIKDIEGIPLAGVIQNSQNRSVTASFNFDKLYKKSKYVKSLDQHGKPKARKRIKQDGDKVTVSKDAAGRTTQRKKTREASILEKLLLRPLFSLRSARLTYKENFNTILPGYTGTPEYFGLDDAFTNPGTGFILGFQPDLDHDNPNNYLVKAANNGWLTDSKGQNQELVQLKGQNIEAKFKIEPWKDFKIDVDFKKSYNITHSEVYKNLEDNGVEGFKSLAARDMGSFDMTYFNMNTLFGYSIDELFTTFEDNRTIISSRLPNNDTSIHDEDGYLYRVGYGKQSSAVLVPSFIAAYTNQDPNLVDLDLEESVRKRTYVPKPNWNLRYDGLSKLPWFRERFSSFTLQHAYTSRMRVSNFNSDVQFDRVNPFAETRLNGNYYTRVEIPAIQISENFNPIIGLKMKTKKDFTMEFEYVKSRDLNLKINTSSQLEEDKKTSFVFGLGYTIKDSNFLKKGRGRKRRSSRSRTNKDEEKKPGRINTGGKVTSTRGSDMTFMLNVAWNDNQFFVHQLDSNLRQEDNETRGDKGFQFSPSVDYILNDNLTLRGFFDYNTNTPYGSTNYQRTNIAGGIVMRLTLN